MKLLPAAAAVLLLLPLFVHAAAIGASPARIEFTQVLSGGYAERSIIISTDTDGVLYGSLRVDGDIRSWVEFRPNTTGFNVTRSQPRSIAVIMRPPADLPVGTYSGRLTVGSESEGTTSSRAGSIVQSAVILPVTVMTTGSQTVRCQAGAFEVKDIEEGRPLELWITTENTGNVRIRPLVTLTVWDALQEKKVLQEELRGPEILPTVTSRFFLTAPHELAIGQYWIELHVPECQAESTHTFSIVEKGGIADKGQLTSVSAPETVAVGETVPITAVFFNNGERIVTAQFSGTVKHNKKVIDVVRSEEIEVASGQVEKLMAYFVPKTAGTYTVTGRVTYNKKLTFEKGASFTAEFAGERQRADFSFLLIPVYALLVITSFFLVRKIRRKRRGF